MGADRPGTGLRSEGTGVKTIFRYQVPVDDNLHTITLTGRILHVACRRMRIVEFWAMVGDTPAADRHFRVYGTGQQLPEQPLCYLGTALDGLLVWHLIEEFPLQQLAVGAQP